MGKYKAPEDLEEQLVFEDRAGAYRKIRNIALGETALTSILAAANLQDDRRVFVAAAVICLGNSLFMGIGAHRHHAAAELPVPGETYDVGIEQIESRSEIIPHPVVVDSVTLHAQSLVISHTNPLLP